MNADRDDLIAVVAHLTRLSLRRRGEPQDARFAMAGPLIANLCDAMGFDNESIAAAAMAQVAAMERQQ